MRTARSTSKLRTALQNSAILVGAGAATAFGWSAWVDTDSVTGATRQSAVLVCQATGDGGYVLIRVLPERLEEYRRNPNNIVPAPAGGCPAGVGAGQEPAPTTTSPPTPPPVTDTAPTVTAEPPPDPQISPAPTTTTSKTPTPTPPRRRVAPTTTGGGSTVQRDTARRPAAYTGKMPANLERLPNTGNETALLLFLGADLLLLGAGLRLRARGSRF